MITIDTDDKMKILGSHIVSEGVFTWKIKIVSFTFTGFGGPPLIGIIEDDKDYLTDFFEDKETKEMPEYLKMMYI